MAEMKLLAKVSLCLMALYAVCCLLYALIGGEQIRIRRSDTGDVVSVQATAPLEGAGVMQPFTLDAQWVESVSFMTATGGKTVSGTLVARICRDGQALWETSVPAADLPDFAMVQLTLEPPLAITPNETLQLALLAPDASPGEGPMVAYGNLLEVTQGRIAREVPAYRFAAVNGAPLDGAICYRVSGGAQLWIGTHFWAVAAAGFLLLVCWLLRCRSRCKAGRSCSLLTLAAVFKKYRFLLSQLVSRDFKTKYKRSFFGLFWSFLNPLMTMLVQYFVFSTLFQSNIENYPVYLLVGIIWFGFFSEVTSLTLASIVGNSSLINKVYVPKYIYPLSRALSSLVNFLISLIPLALMLLITRTPVTPAVLLMPFGVLCLFMLSLGVGLFLSAAMVFFRDIQFLWGIASMLWMYCTPIFYPESIIPPEFLTLYKLNPLYHMIKYVRIILIDGVSPSPQHYLYGLLFGGVPLLLGLLFFKRTQDKFILYL